MSDLRFEAGCNLQGKKREKKNTWKEREQGHIHEPKSRAGGQERRKSKVSPTDRRTEWVVELRACD